MPANLNLNSIPQEILEHIAFRTVTAKFLGPPATIIPLLLTNRRLHSFLSASSSPHLYARIFAFKYDVAPVIRRLGPERTSATVLSAELQRRCSYLTRIRNRTDTKIIQFPAVKYDKKMVSTILWMSYLMMLENNGKNEQQLRDYAEMDVWLTEYWFDSRGASFATISIKIDKWPPNDTLNSLAMWLFWFLLNPDTFEKNNAFRDMISILQLMALNAHEYQICSPSWTEFMPKARNGDSSPPFVYSETQSLTPPPLALPAILSFLTLVNKLPYIMPTLDFTKWSGTFTFSRQGVDWDNEWERCLGLGQTSFHEYLSGAFTPGSIQGVWEGTFTYTEFATYAALLVEAPPPILDQDLAVRHRQTWKLQEYHLLAPVSSLSETDINMVTDGPLSVGDPMQAHLPEGTKFYECPDGINVRDPAKTKPLFYHKTSCVPAPSTTDGINSDGNTTFVQDVLVIGEGHSAWGQFSLRGRIRPCDGLVTLLKEYVDGVRGKWLYRGYLVGNIDGNIGGRWRDTTTPPDMPGYEGCFAMSRRQ